MSARGSGAFSISGIISRFRARRNGENGPEALFSTTPLSCGKLQAHRKVVSAPVGGRENLEN
jgi:hypothetical protein